MTFVTTDQMLVDGTITPVGGGIFLKDLPFGAVSLVAAGGPSPAFSPDGSKIAFLRVAPDLMSSDIFVADLMAGAVTFVSHATVGFSSTYQPLSFSPDGNQIAFESNISDLVVGDTNNTTDIFVKAFTTGAITSFPPMSRALRR